MKKYYLSCLFLAFLSLSLHAQKDKDKNKDVPPFGSIDKAALEMKTCDFDPDAEAVVLFETGNLVCDIMGRVELEIHVRMKILKEKGLERANLHIPYHSYRNDESVRKMTAHTYNLDASGNITTSELDKKSIIEKPLNKRFTEMIVALPDVKVGSVFEYKYILSGAGLRTWYFQRSIPVVYSRYKIDFPEQIELSSVPKCVLPFDVQQIPNRSARTITQYSMSNVPALRDEPYILNEGDYLQRVETRLIAINQTNGQRTNYTRSWPGIIKQLMEDEDFGDQLKKNVPRTDDLDKELKTVTDPFQRMKIIHHYVRKNMEWNGYSSIWALNGIKAAWKDKKGTSGEINLILVNLLKDAGLDAYPMLVSTHDNGLVNTMIPSYQQFNKVLAYVKIGQDRYVLDGTDKETPSHMIPEDVMLTQGLVLEKLETFQWGWQTLWDDKSLKKNMVVIQGEIDEKGTMKGNAYVSSQGYERLERNPYLKKGKDEFISHFYTSRNDDTKVDSLSFENEKEDSLPLVQKFNFTHSIESSGDYSHFSANMFSGLEKNPFLAENRFSDVFFGTNQSYTIIGSFRIPPNASLEELPKNIRLMMPDSSVSMTRICAQDNGLVSVRMTLEFRKPFYANDEYADFREFYKQLFEMLSEQFVYTRKTKPRPKP